MCYCLWIESYAVPVPSNAVICLILGYLRWVYVLEVTEVASTLFDAVFSTYIGDFAVIREDIIGGRQVLQESRDKARCSKSQAHKGCFWVP